MNNDIQGINEAYRGTFFVNANEEEIIVLFSNPRTEMRGIEHLYQLTKDGTLDKSAFTRIVYRIAKIG